MALKISANNKLAVVKLIHTIIWVFFNIVIFYLYYAVLMNRIDKWVWFCIGIIVIEGIVLLLFKKICPITLIARRYSDSTRDNFDIFLPNWLARYNKIIYISLFIAVLLLLIFRIVQGK
jgi:hypothetical protein